MITGEVPGLRQAEVKPWRWFRLMEYMARSWAGCKGAAALPKCEDGVTKQFSLQSWLSAQHCWWFWAGFPVSHLRKQRWHHLECPRAKADSGTGLSSPPSFVWPLVWVAHRKYHLSTKWKSKGQIRCQKGNSDLSNIRNDKIYLPMENQECSLLYTFPEQFWLLSLQNKVLAII